VNMAKMSGAVTAQWFDPSNGTYSSISGSPFANAGTKQFAPSGVNNAGDQDWLLVLTASAVPDTQPPTAPANLSALAVSATQVNLSWNASADNVGVTGYKVFVNGILLTSTGATFQVESGLNPNSTYTFTVSAYDAAGNVSPLSSPATVTTPASDTTPPTTPANLQATNVTSSSASLSWTASTDNVAVAGYQIYKNGVLLASTSFTNYVATGLAASTTYSFTVSAFDASNNVSGSTAPLGVTTATASAVAPAQIQMASNIATGGKTVSIAFSAPSTAGNLIVAYVVYDNSGAATISDTGGNVYQSAVGPTPFGAGNSWRAQIFYAKNITGGAVKVTATFSTAISSFGLIYVHEYSGLDSVNPVDAVISSAGTGSALNSGSLNTTTGTDLLFAAGASDNEVTTFSPGFTTRSVAFGNLTEDKVVSAIGTFNATATHSGTFWIMQLVAFRPPQ
jgi:chitodextrinase